MEKKFTRLSLGGKRHIEKALTRFSDADWGPQGLRATTHFVGSRERNVVYCPREKGVGHKEDGVREGRRSGMNKMEQSLQINVVIPSTHPK